MIQLKNLFKSTQQPQITSREKHKWVLISRSYATPVRSFDGINMEKLDQKLVEKLMLGVTTYLWECSLTGDIKTEEILGSDQSTLDDITLKAKQYGPQFFTDDSETKFIIKVYEEQIDPKTLPMRRV